MASITITMPLAGSGTLTIELPKGTDPEDIDDELAADLFFGELDDGHQPEVEWEYLTHITRGNVCSAPQHSVDWFVEE